MGSEGADTVGGGQRSKGLCLLTVHAHPDDEASKTAGVVARYSAEGARAVLVTCTGGEAGDVLNAAVEVPDDEAALAALRFEELRDAARTLGYGAVHLLGYRDSGMLGTEHNDHPESFARADLDEATGRLVEIMRRERPHVVIAYADEQSFYPHPDHVRAHEVAVAAFDACGDAERFVDAGPAWQPAKLYYTAWSRALVESWLEASDADAASPFRRFLDSGAAFADERFTTRIDVRDQLEQRRQALLAHRSQVDPESFWMRIRVDVMREIFPYEDYILERSHVEVELEGDWEVDLFSGLRGVPD